MKKVAFLLLICASILFACKKEDSPIPVQTVKLSLDSAYLNVDSTMQMVAIVSPSDASNQEITWSSLDSNIATISNTGVVQGKAVGKTTITATTVEGDISAQCIVTILSNTVPVTGISLSQSNTEIEVDNSFTLTATIAPLNASLKDITWTSSDLAIATVDANGVVSGKNFGSVSIIGTTVDGAKTATCIVTVIPTIVSDEIPISDSGYFELDKCPTTNANILYSKTIANYLNYDLEDNTGSETDKSYLCNYFIVNNGDTIYNSYDLIFAANVAWNNVTISEQQFKLSDFGRNEIDQKPYFKGWVNEQREDRLFGIRNDTMQIAQDPIESTIVTYKFISIQKDEKYINVLVEGKYLVKFILNNNNYYTFPMKVDLMYKLRSEKYIYSKNFTSIDISNRVTKLMSF